MTSFEQRAYPQWGVQYTKLETDDQNEAIHRDIPPLHSSREITIDKIHVGIRPLKEKLTNGVLGVGLTCI